MIARLANAIITLRLPKGRQKPFHACDGDAHSLTPTANIVK